ncbi:AI-2E family transporter [Fulvivirga sediminis]|uniref:AI-2E family transporter n=1 Tax=Fulvivirga sediminis TaxID=2803949 RepID=A0A937F800_9BACT|nr:AI-2E family transporter [Fulvivirga sediminis]MBL3657410.1 AI-2E family transporter [Fulvivirga sediminis]
MLGKTLTYILIGLLVFLLLSWLFIDIVIYVAIAIVVSSILRPVTQYIANTQVYNIRVPRLMAVIISYCVLIGFFTSFIILFIPLISEQIEVILGLDYRNLYLKLSLPLTNIEDFLINNNLTTQPKGFIVDSLRSSIVELISNAKFGNILNNVISVTGQILVGILAVSFISFFFLYEMGSMRRKLISFIPNRYFEVTIAAYNKIERLLSNYLIGLLFQIFSIFTIASLGLSILGIKYALTIALFAAVANLIPYLGPLFGACFGVIVGVSTGTDLFTTNNYLFLIIKIGSVFATVQIVDNILLQPLIFSKSVKAHPLEIFIIIFAGASLAGIPGMIAAIPVYTVFRVFISELYIGYRSYSVFKLQKK